MAEAIIDKPVSKPKRPKAGELLGNLEMRAALEPFIANDPLGKLGYELFRKGIINVDALVFPYEKYGQKVEGIGIGGRSKIGGEFVPSGSYKVKPALEALESQKSLDTSSKPSLWYSTGRDKKRDDDFINRLFGKTKDAIRPGFSDMQVLSHELRHAAMNYLKNKGLYELPKEVDGDKFHPKDFEEALVTLQDIKRIKDKDYYTKDLDASKKRQPKEEFTSLLNSIYSEVSDVAQKELTNLNVPKETKPDQKIFKKKGWVSKTKDFLGLDRGGIPMQRQMKKLKLTEGALVTTTPQQIMSGEDIAEVVRSNSNSELINNLSDAEIINIIDISSMMLGDNMLKLVKGAKGGYILKSKVGLDRGGIPMQRQMEMFQDGGLEQDGNTIDPESGNDVPVGSAQEEVRDDIPAQLSEGEFVFPADVVRYIGLEKLMMIRQEAKAGLKRMEEMGQMGNSEEATIPDDIPFDINDLELADEPVPAYRGGAIQSFAPGGYADDINVQPGGVAQGQSFGNNLVDLPRIGIPEQPRPVIPPISEDGGYTPPTVSDTPVQAPVDPAPPFNVFVPPVADSYKEWVNEDGIIINVPYFRGNVLPGYSVPEGFTLKESESVVPEQEGILSDITQEPERDREREIQEAEQAKKDRDRSYDNVISQIMRDNPGATLNEITKKIKDGDAIAYTNPLTGKVVKAPGFLFDEEGIENAYNRTLETYNELKGDFIDDSDRGTTFDANFKAKQKAEAQAKAEAEAAAYQKSRLISVQKAEEEFAKKVAQEAAEKAAEKALADEAEKDRTKAVELAKTKKAQEIEAKKAAARKAALERINRQKEKDANEAQRRKDREAAHEASKEGYADRDFQRDSSGGKNSEKGGIAAKPKPKKKKTMKRGGIASKK